MNRKFLDIQGAEDGPLIIIVAAIHGNEIAGIHALEKLNQLFENSGPAFSKISIKKGRIVGIIGNLKAAIDNVRFLDIDLNRIWYQDIIEGIEQKKKISSEYAEAFEMLQVLMEIQKEHSYSQKFLLDLHTTSADGFFAICTESQESEHIALHLHAPVVRGLMKDVQGSLIQYFDQKPGKERFVSLAFEAGQHYDPKATDRMFGVILHLLEYLEMIGHPVSASDYYSWLEDESSVFPREVEIIYSYKINEDENWQMLPGFKNFMAVKKNQPLAFNQFGEIAAPFDGLLLMPRYQPLGNDGFFIVKTIVN